VSLRGLGGACAIVLAALVAGGCGTTGLQADGAGDAQRGKELFVEKCGSCHVLADAGTRGVIGPNLDDAFGRARADGLGQSTIRSVVRGQIAYPVEEPPTGAAGMPANIVEGEDADSVAEYVSRVAGVETAAAPGGGGGQTTTGATTPAETTPEETDTGGTTTAETSGGEAPDGEAIFASSGCGSCHVLAAAGASGSVGPNLDETKPPKDLVIDRVTNGKGSMPPFKDSLSAAEIEAVADYVVASE
jgi:mono/diheme cytochrome c family protein